MPRAFPFLSSLFVLSICVWSNLASGNPPTCAVSLRIVERALAAEVDRVFEIFDQPEVVEPSQVEEANRVTKAALRHVGGVYERIGSKELRKRRLTTALEEEIHDGSISGNLTHFGQLFEVKELPPAKSDASVTDRFLTHPETAAILAYLRGLGVKVYIDSSLNLTGFSGQYDPDAKAIVLRTNSSFLTLLHEAAHAEFDHYHIDRFIKKARGKVSKGKSLADLLSNHRFRRYGIERLNRVTELVSRGFPTLALDERMSVDREIAALRDAGYQDWSGPDHYGNDHLLNELTQLALIRPLTAAENQSFLGALVMELEDQASALHHSQVPALYRQLAGEGEAPSNDLPPPSSSVNQSQNSLAEHNPQANPMTALLGMYLAAGATVVGVYYHAEVGQFLVLLSNGSWISVEPPDENKKGKRPASGH